MQDQNQTRKVTPPPFTNLFAILGLILILALSSLFLFERAAPGFAQIEESPIRLVRELETEETGLTNPAGLAHAAKTDTFLVIADRGLGKPSSDTTQIAEVSTFADLVGSARIAAQVRNPLNIAFDDRGSRLLIFQSPANQLLEVRLGPDGKLDPTSLARTDAARFGVQDPQGMSVDPASGDVYLLDAAGPQIVRIEPDANGSFQDAVVSTTSLASFGVADARGLAFDPTTAHLHTIGLSEQRLYELTLDGQVAAVRSLSEFGFTNPDGMVFAPSGDQTDDPAEMSLYITDSSAPQGSPPGSASLQDGNIAAQPAGAAPNQSGRIVELSFTALVAPAPSDFTSSLVATTDMSLFDPPSPDPSGLAYLPTSNTLLMSDGEVEETVKGITHFQGANVWELTLAGSVVDTANISKIAPTVTPMTNEPTGSAWNPNNGHYYFSDDGKKQVFDLDPGPDGEIGTRDDSWTYFSTSTHGSGDPEGITYDPTQNHVFVSDGVNMEVYEFTLAGNLVNHFDVERYGVADPESVEYNVESGTLFVMSSNRSTPVLIETTTDGSLLQTIDISASSGRADAGLAYAPASNGSGEKRFYIVDRGIDNNSDPYIIDGKMYEMTAPSSAPPVDSPPTANDDSASTTKNTPVTIDVAANDYDPNANLVPASANVACSTCTLPSNGALANNSDGTFTYTPNTDFVGTDGFVYEICDTTDLCATASVSISVISRAADLIFADGFESGDFSAWSSAKVDGGDLSVSAAAALVGSNGMQALINDTRVIFVTDETPDAEPHYRARFYFDPNSISMADNSTHYIFDGLMGTSDRNLRIEFRLSSGSYQIRAKMRDDSTKWHSTGWFTISDAPHAIELDWWAATAAGANDGGLNLWVDGAQVDGLSAIDNDTRRIDLIRLGMVAAIDSGTSGTSYFDGFESRRDTYIGP